MTAYVVDTNVLAAANRLANHASLQCVVACSHLLGEIQRKGTVVIDDELRVLREYKNYASAARPGVGNAFLKWIYTNLANPSRCELLHLLPRSGNGEDYHQFPDDPELSDFDRADRKFAALAVASIHDPPVANATDSDWWHYRAALAKHGITVQFLCPELMPK